MVQDADPEVVVFLEAGDPGFELGRSRGVDGIPGFRSVEREDEHPTDDLDVQHAGDSSYHQDGPVRL